VVLLLQGQGHGFVFAVVAGVVHAHHPLGVGEFEHHVGHQIALGQQAGPFGQRPVGADGGGDKAGQGADALGLLPHRAQLLLEQHMVQLLQAGDQRGLAVGIEEELGVGQARAYHLLVAADDLARVLGLDVGDEDEGRQQAAVGVVHREVLLVTLHGVHQGFRRHRQELLLEGGGEHHRPLHQGGDFFQQLVVQIGDTARGGGGLFAPALIIALRRSKSASTLPRSSSCCR
jgi:hypothetical protein